MRLTFYRGPLAIVAISMLAVTAAAETDEDAAKAAAARDARALGWLIQRGVRVLAQPVAPAVPAAAAPAIDPARRQQIEQQAKQMEQFFKPTLHSELELIRGACGGLAPAARQEILVAGQKAVTGSARGFAERQMTGRLGQDDFDPRMEIRTGLIKALEPLADPAEFTAYRLEIERRDARRAEAARVMIVARVDRQFDLTAEQRARIETELERKWQPGWARDLGSNRVDMRINDRPAAPDYAANAIVPHLAADQAVAWEAWCRSAGSRMLGQHFTFGDGQGIQQADPWWGR